MEIKEPRNIPLLIRRMMPGATEAERRIFQGNAAGEGTQTADQARGSAGSTFRLGGSD
jgi:hypothetical protein